MRNFPANEAAFPVDTEDLVNFGITAKMYAAIHLCIPDSGVDWLDAMIRRKQRDDLAAKMLEGVASNPANAYAVADAMLKAGDPDFAEVKKDGA